MDMKTAERKRRVYNRLLNDLTSSRLGLWRATHGDPKAREMVNELIETLAGWEDRFAAELDLDV